VGAFVKTIMINNSDAAEINIKGLSTGIYLLELVNANEKSWKKIIIN
jgi:LEA14-like dessication related protein